MAKNSNQSEWVTFNYSPESPVSSVLLKGEWNNWEPITMKQKKSGEYFVRRKLPHGEWQFGYEVDENWETPHAEKTIPSPYGSLNAIVNVKEAQ